MNILPFGVSREKRRVRTKYGGRGEPSVAKFSSLHRSRFAPFSGQIFFGARRFLTFDRRAPVYMPERYRTKRTGSYTESCERKTPN